MRSAIGLARSLAIYYGNPLRQRALTRFYAGILKPGDLVFDIGAHVGNRTRALRRAGARVVALEPQAPFSTFLRRTLPRDVVLLEMAAGPQETVAQMAVSRLHPTVSSVKAGFADAALAAPGFEHVRWDAVQQVQVTTLDALIATHGMPAFIKIDVEGFELEVLQGLGEPVPQVAVEYLPGLPRMARDVIERLSALGHYRYNVVRGEEGRFLWPEWRDAAQADAWLAARSPDEKHGDLYARLDTPEA
ncbi:FkbM family methyltransferase [Halovulum dunhuangense]|uniref:FkbM family methyltransferase n=1 Tax=Halovulum dunhuangense TaxID=1505036 RepID=A0A849KQV4_9RHOB|nr:FkbM family methyltransferase [Halovulum dunhuangense]